VKLFFRLMPELVFPSFGLSGQLPKHIGTLSNLVFWGSFHFPAFNSANAHYGLLKQCADDTVVPFAESSRKRRQ